MSKKTFEDGRNRSVDDSDALQTLELSYTHFKYYVKYVEEK